MEKENRNEYIRFRVTDFERQLLKIVSKRQEMSMSDFVRQSVKQELKQHEGEIDLEKLTP